MKYINGVTCLDSGDFMEDDNEASREAVEEAVDLIAEFERDVAYPKVRD